MEVRPGEVRLHQERRPRFAPPSLVLLRSAWKRFVPAERSTLLRFAPRRPASLRSGTTDGSFALQAFRDIGALAGGGRDVLDWPLASAFPLAVRTSSAPLPRQPLRLCDLVGGHLGGRSGLFRIAGQRPDERSDPAEECPSEQEIEGEDRACRQMAAPLGYHRRQEVDGESADSDRGYGDR